ncbi:MAG: hypothetical protein MMC23_009909 [Stictis urceolatum]|nr:hypothetical protein [Stictis urceolata]
MRESWSRASAILNSTFLEIEGIIRLRIRPCILRLWESPLTDKAKVIYIREFFEEERLPTHLRWRKSETQIAFDDIQVLVEQTANIMGEDPGPPPV